MVTLLAASPGMGKSLVALDLARRITKASPSPTARPSPPQANPSPRRRRAGARPPPPARRRLADRRRVALPMLTRTRGTTSIYRLRPISAGSSSSAMRFTPPWSSSTRSPPRPTHRDEQQSRPRRPKCPRRLAEAFGTAMLVIHHLRKPRAQAAGSHHPSVADSAVPRTL